MNTRLWKPRSVSETMDVYRDWAATYDADVLASGYVTPTRIATALADILPPSAQVLDFGCGTGLAGAALRAAGFTTVDGTDISAEMLALATPKGIYRKLWQSEPGQFDWNGTYHAIVAAGVVSLGAAPASVLADLLDTLKKGQMLAFSYNDPTLADDNYVAALDNLIASGVAKLVFRAHGPHLPAKGMGSDVIILRRA